MQPTTSSSINPQILRLILPANILLVVISIVLLVLGLAGPGTIKVDVPDNTDISLNGVKFEQGSIRKVHAGTYTLRVNSPQYSAVEQDYIVKPFHSATINSSALTKREPVDILRSLIPASNDYGPPTFTQVSWFENNTWLAGIAGPSSGAPVALYYKNNTWHIGYFNQIGYDSDKNALPDSVKNYILTLENQYAN